MNGHMEIHQRRRYNIWDLLADIGGLYDGIFLVFSIFMSVFNELAFETDLQKKSWIDRWNKRSAEKEQGDYVEKAEFLTKELRED